MTIGQSLEEAGLFPLGWGHNGCCQALNILFCDLEGDLRTTANHDLIFTLGLSSYDEN